MFSQSGSMGLSSTMYVGLQEVKRLVKVLTTTPINVPKATGPKVRRRAFKLANSNNLTPQHHPQCL